MRNRTIFSNNIEAKIDKLYNAPGGPRAIEAEKEFRKFSKQYLET